MKNVMVANLNPKSLEETHTKYKSQEDLEVLMKAQIENSLEVGWGVNDIILLTNFAFEHLGVRATQITLNEHCFTGSKMFAIQWLMTQDNDPCEIYWSHDLDCWQGAPFDCPVFKDIGITEYSLPKFAGGSVFWRGSAKDIVEAIIAEINKTHAPREEPILNQVLKSPPYQPRVTILNSTFNLGCSGFRTRFPNAIKPVKVSHFHPTNRIAWEMHALDRYQYGYKAITNRLEKLIRKFFPQAATALSAKDKDNKGKRMVPPPGLW